MHTPNFFARIFGLTIFAALAIGIAVFATGSAPVLARLGTLSSGGSAAQMLDTGAPAALLLHVDALVLNANGAATTLTAQVLDAQGKPVPGATVNFGGTLGTVSPSAAATGADGRASVTFNAGPVAGQARLMATVNGLQQEAALQLIKPGVDATGRTLALSADATALKPGAETQVRARLVDGVGQPVAGASISVFGALGEVSPGSALSDDDGRVVVTYRAGMVPGAARLTGLAGYASSSAVVVIADDATPTPTATATATPTSTPTVTPTPTVPGGPANDGAIYLPMIHQGN